MGIYPQGIPQHPAPPHPMPGPSAGGPGEGLGGAGWREIAVGPSHGAARNHRYSPCFAFRARARTEVCYMINTRGGPAMPDAAQRTKMEAFYDAL